MKKSPYLIKIANINDSNEIAKINVQAWKESYSNLFEKKFLGNIKWKDFAKYRIDSFGKLNKATFLSVINDKIIGFCDAGKARTNQSFDDLEKLFGEVYALYVIDKHKSNGVGKELLNQASVYLKTLGFKKIIIWTLQENKHAINFYLHLGYERTMLEKTLLIGGVEYREIALVKSLV